MRQLLLLLALALVASLAPVAEASSVRLSDDQTAMSRTDVTTAKSVSAKAKSTKKSKNTKKKTKSSGSVTLDSIPAAKRGTSGLEITAKASKADLTCDLKLTYADTSEDQPDSVTSDKDKTCTFEVDIPDERAAVGQATAEVTLKDAGGKKLASDKKTFTVK